MSKFDQKLSVIVLILDQYFLGNYDVANVKGFKPDGEFVMYMERIIHGCNDSYGDCDNRDKIMCLVAAIIYLDRLILNVQKQIRNKHKVFAVLYMLALKMHGDNMFPGVHGYSIITDYYVDELVHSEKRLTNLLEYRLHIDNENFTKVDNYFDQICRMNGIQL